jgi:hypothetical protein
VLAIIETIRRTNVASDVAWSVARSRPALSRQDDYANDFRQYVVADAVLIEPVSGRRFPANREKNSEFRNF